MITLTQSALDQVKRIRAESGSQKDDLRIAVEAGGCSGFTYEMFFDSEVGEDDTVFSQDGVRVLVDGKSLAFLDGSKVDYVVKSSFEAGFRFDNPNVAEECGCGQSFSAS